MCRRGLLLILKSMGWACSYGVHPWVLGRHDCACGPGLETPLDADLMYCKDLS